MTFSALDSELTGPLFASEAMRAVFSDGARIEAMLKAEAALAEAEAKHGLVPDTLGATLRRIKPGDLDIAAIGAATANAGVPAIPFVKAVEAKLPEPLRGSFHRGTTSQDILDTATMIQASQGLDLIAGDLTAIIDGLIVLASRYARTPQVGRTYGQHAAPITFGHTVAAWLDGVADVAADLERMRARALVVSLGGPVGTLAGLEGKAPSVAADMAAILKLGIAPSWHVSRARVAGLGTWLATLVGALAKMATDVVFLSSTEVGEISEAQVAGRGGSSAMPHKHNPVSATVILAAHGVAPSLAAALVQSMAAPLQRPAGAWHAEWHALPQLFGLASGALREARRLAESLVVHETRMRANLDLTRGLIYADAATAFLAGRLGRDKAHSVVEAAAKTAREQDISLAMALEAEKAMPPDLKRTLPAVFDPTPSIEAAATLVARAVEHAKAIRRTLPNAGTG